MKRSNKWLIFAVAIAAMFLVTSCTGLTQGGTNNNNDAFVGGTVGLNTYLIDGMPPSVINDANTFPFGFGVAIENQGEADVGPGKGSGQGAQVPTDAHHPRSSGPSTG